MIWPLVGPRLQAAVEKLGYVEYDVGHIQRLLREGQAQLWVADNGKMIAITRIGVYPNVKRLIIDFIEGSSPEEYFDHMEYIEAWAVMHGATQAEAEVRPGLERIARKQGWTRRRVQMYKQLTKGYH